MTKWRRSVGEEFFHPDLIDPNVHFPDLPSELDPYIFGIAGIGPCVMAIQERDFADAVQDGDYDLWETDIPCRLFMKCTYRFYEGYVIVDIPVDEGENWSHYYEPEEP